MEEPGKPELTNLRLMVEELQTRYNEAEDEFKDMKIMFQQTDAYKEAYKHHYCMLLSDVPGYSAVFGNINALIADLKLQADIRKRRLDDWITGRIRNKGFRVRVIKGKKDIGLEGTVFWYGDSQWGTRIGIKTGEVGPDNREVVYWNYTRNCDLLLTKEQLTAIGV